MICALCRSIITCIIYDTWQSARGSDMILLVIATTLCDKLKLQHILGDQISFAYDTVIRAYNTHISTNRILASVA